MMGLKFYFFILLKVSAAFPFKIVVNTSVVISPKTKFWRSTGLSPPKSDTASVKEYLLSDDLEVNLAIISALPGNGIQYVRIHWLLSLLTTYKNGTINWSDMDDVMDRMVDNGLIPIVELMGNSTFLDQKKSKIRQFWKQLTSDIITRYEGKYGKSILNWKFETWNEPDLKMYNALNFTLCEYIEYVEGCGEGVKSTQPKLQFGGPAGLFKNPNSHPLCWGLLDHCNKSESRCHLDYISFHKKGNGTTSEIINSTYETIGVLKKHYNNLASLSFVNDEADILSGWWKAEEWRGDVRYAAAVVKTIIHFSKGIKEYNIERISIDNGFLNEPPLFFNQRTLLARFYSEERSSFIQKPVYGAMGLLGLLGNEELHVKFRGDERFSITGTCTKNRKSKTIESIGILIGFSEDKVDFNASRMRLQLKISVFLPPDWEYKARYALYKLENSLPHPQKVWEESGNPINPTKSRLIELLDVQEPHKMMKGVVKRRKFILKPTISLPSITFLQICPQFVNNTKRILSLKAYNISFNEVLLIWKLAEGEERCVKTFSVERSRSPQGSFIRVNKRDIIFNSFTYIYEKDTTHLNREETVGFYRVTAVDFWGRKGPYSNTVIYGPYFK